MKIYYTYILTNESKSVLYVGISSNLSERLLQHFESRGQAKSFTGRYYCYNLISFEEYFQAMQAISREKEIKKWSRRKKEELIYSKNPNWDFLNSQFVLGWRDLNS